MSSPSAPMVPEQGPANHSTPDWGSGPPRAPGGSGWVAAALCVVIALTAAANSLLIALICAQPALRNTSNFFLVSLFTSDLMVGLVVMPPAMLNVLYGRWVLARGLCLLWAAFDVMCCSASILNLCLISLDRYLLILSPLRYKLRMTPARALALVLGAWSLAALASFLPLLLGWHEPGRARAPAPGQCRLLASLPFVLVASGLTFFLPSGAICFTYSRILLAARKQAVQVASLSTGAAGQALETLQVWGRSRRETRAWGPGRNEQSLGAHWASTSQYTTAGTSKWSFPAPIFLLNARLNTQLSTGPARMWARFSRVTCATGHSGGASSLHWPLTRLPHHGQWHRHGITAQKLGNAFPLMLMGCIHKPLYICVIPEGTFLIS